MLEIGTGSGYQAAILVAMQLDVYTIEIVPDLKTRSTRWLTELGYMHTGRLHTLLGDGYMGWPSAAPFDGIVVTCSPVRRPYPLSSHPPTMLAQDLVRGRGDSGPGGSFARRIMCRSRSRSSSVSAVGSSSPSGRTAASRACMS